METWKPITGYEGYYEVSDNGNVRSVDRYITDSKGRTYLRKSIIKKQTLDKDGYPTVKLSKNGNDERIPVHKLVALEFVSGYMPCLEVDHIDFNRKNNKSDNLKWSTHKDNVEHTVDAGRHVCCSDISGSNNPNYGNHVLSEIYRNDKELSKQKQGRPGSQNGRSRSVSISNDISSFIFGTLSECAAFLIDSGLSNSSNVSYLSTLISRNAKQNKPYAGFNIKLL